MLCGGDVYGSVGILHLGNIAFNPSRDTEGGSQISSGTECGKVGTSDTGSDAYVR